MKIKPLEVKVYNEGTCFICGKPCDSYAHYECALSYADHKNMKCKELCEKKEAIQESRIKIKEVNEDD